MALPPGNQVADHPAPPVLLNRRRVAALKGCSTATVRRLEKKGVLHPILHSSGAMVFDPAEVEALPPRKSRPKKIQRRSSGEVAAAAFQLFAKGYSLVQVVQLMAIDPEELQRLYFFYEKNNLRAFLQAEHQTKLARMTRPIRRYSSE